MIGYVISNSEALAKITGEQRNVLQRFIDRLESLFARNSGYLDRLSPETRRAFYDVYREADAIAEQFKAAIEKQSEVVKEKGVEVERDEKKTSGEEVKKSRDLTSTDFVKDKYFDRKINKWNDLNENYISVGTVKRNSVLNKIGVPTGKVYYDVSKIKKGFADHKDHLNSDILKRVPDILNHPIVITEYKPGQSSNTISIYGNLIINNKPIVVGLVVIAGNGNNIISKIRSVHMQSDLKSQITNESILYLSENKKETNAWFNSYAGIDVPEVGTQLGIIRSIDFNNNIPQKEDIVNSILLQNDVKHSRDLSEDISERFNSENKDIRWSRDLSDADKNFSSKSIDKIDHSWYNKIKLSSAEYYRLQSEALTWNADKRNRLITHTLSNDITYRYTIDDDGIVHIYGREPAVNIHERNEEYDNTNREKPYSITEELWIGQGNNSEHINTGKNGRKSGKDDTNDNLFVSGERRSYGTGDSKNRTNANRKPKGYQFKEDGSVEVSNDITYRYVIDDDAIVHIYERKPIGNKHEERGAHYANSGREKLDSVAKELWAGQRNNNINSEFSRHGRKYGKDDTNDNLFVSGERRSYGTGDSKNRTNANRKPKGYQFNKDGSVEVTYSDGTKETESEKHSRDLTEREMSDNKIKTLAGHLRGKYNSTYSKDDLTAELKEIYAIYEKGHFDEVDTCSATA